MKTTGSSRTKHIINASLPIFDRAKSVGIEILNMVYILSVGTIFTDQKFGINITKLKMKMKKEIMYGDIFLNF